MNDEVLGARGDKYADGLRQGTDPVAELLNDTARRRADAHSDQCLHAAAMAARSTSSVAPWMTPLARSALVRSRAVVGETPTAAQHTRVYDEYLDAVDATPADEVNYYAVSIVGPRNRVDRMVDGLP